jgi:GNAT superfamily N-acetyltransferase
MAETRRAEPSLAPITEAHRNQLVAFPCRTYDPWSEEVELMVHDYLLDAVLAGDVDAAGVLEGDDLCAVAAWNLERSSTPLRCRSILLVVRMGRRRRGYGRLLKQVVLDEARRAGARVVVSVVHFDNDPMIGLNVAFGANVERIPGDPDHLLCVIPLEPAS